MRSGASRDAFPSGAGERHGFNGGAVAVCFEGLLREHVLAGGPASHACRRGSGSTRGFDFLFWGLFHTLRRDGTRGLVSGLRAASGEDGTRRFWFGGFFHMLRRDGTRIAFCFCGLWEVLCVSLRAVAGAGMRSGASRDAFPSGAGERHGFNGGVVAVCFEGLLREHVLAGGPASHACRRGSGSTRGF